MARVEREDARAFAGALGVKHQWHESHEIENREYVANDASRCYHCKTELFRISRDIVSHALIEGCGCRWLACGYNDSDKILYLQGVVGVAGDMFAASFVDAGLVTADQLQALPALLGLTGVHVHVSRPLRASSARDHADHPHRCDVDR